MCNTSLQGQYVLLGTLCCKQRKKKHLDKKKNIISPYWPYLGQLEFWKCICCSSALKTSKCPTFGDQSLLLLGIASSFCHLSTGWSPVTFHLSSATVLRLKPVWLHMEIQFIDLEVIWEPSPKTLFNTWTKRHRVYNQRQLSEDGNPPGFIG